MARNRKYQSAAIRFGPALKAFLLCLLIGGSAVGYVWQKNQIYQLGQQIKLREANLKFKRRFKYIEKRAREMGKPMQEMTLAEMDGLWDEAKRLERK